MSKSLTSSFAHPLGSLASDDLLPQGGARLEAVYSLMRSLNARSSPQEIVDALVAQLSPFIRFDSLFISLLRDDLLEVIASSRPDHSFSTLSRQERPESDIWHLIDSGAIHKEDDWHSPHSAPTKVRAFINVPLRVSQRIVGVLHLDAFQPQHWTASELRLARLVGEMLGGIVEGAELLRQRDEREHAHAETVAVLRAIQEATSEGSCLISSQGELVSYNRRFARLWGLSESAESYHVEHGTVMRYVLEQLADPDEFLLKISSLFDEPTAKAQDEVALRDGRVFERYSAPAIAPQSDDRPAHTLGRVWTFSDITNRKRTEQQLAHQAFYDAVTGLPNRVLFGERLRYALRGLVRSRRSLAVLFLDLDRFKVVNDSLGHEQGDQLLKQVAARLHASLRPNDTAARFGGDEFVVLLEDVSVSEDATHVAERIAVSLETPFLLESHSFTVTASVGVVIVSDPTESPDNILRKADVAMYRAKNAGKARYELFSDALSRAAMEELQLEIDLAAALKHNEIEVFYQPLVHLEQKRVAGFEAMVRWHHPQRGLVPPDDFIPIAEATGLIIAIDEFVLYQACTQAKEWSETYDFPIIMHVNLSARQFEGAHLVPYIKKLLKAVKLPASQLTVEITESVLMTDPQKATDQLESLKKLGVGIAIDDFGKGYSSLAYLELFPFDLLKIDRAFVSRMAKSPTLVRAITGLGHALGLEIAAEGVEDEEQLKALAELGVCWIQGYLFSRPVPALEAELLLQNRLEISLT